MFNWLVDRFGTQEDIEFVKDDIMNLEAKLGGNIEDVQKYIADRPLSWLKRHRDILEEQYGDGGADD